MSKNSLVFLILILLSAAPVLAEESRKPYWVGLELGGGTVDLKTTASESGSHIYMSFKGGVAVSEQLHFGIELGGYNLQATDLWDPSEGAGINKVFLVIEYRLEEAPRSPFYKFGFGHVSYWNNNPGAIEDSGTGYCAAIGYDFSKNTLGSFGALLSYDVGKADKIEHSAFGLAFVWTFP